jgi:flavin reductase (DIM6/NTAB) family NADH-FMN oxidoreductase RutF
MSWEAVDLSAIDHAARYKLLTGSIIPRPIAWVTTRMENDRTNLAPFSQFIILSTDPGLIGFTIGQWDGLTKDTLEHLQREKEMVVNSVPEHAADLVQATSRDFPHDVSEIDNFGIATISSVMVKPPRLAQSPIQFECQVDQFVPVGRSILVVGRVLLMHVATGLRDAQNHIDHKIYRPLGRIGGRRYVQFDKVIDLSGVQ